MRHGADEDQAIAALLHDVVEDGGGQAMADEIRAEFGGRVAKIVLACSDSVVEDAGAKPPWWQHKVTYIDHLAEADPDVALVSAADKLSNARSILIDYATEGDTFWSKFRTGRVGTLWYYRSIAEILPGRLPNNCGGKQIGDAFIATVAQIGDAVGAEAAEEDWQLALVEVKASQPGDNSGHS